MTLTKRELSVKLQNKLGTSQKTATAHVEAVIDLIKNTLELGENVKIAGFGVFEVKQKKARRGRNPQTGDTITIEPRRIISFKPSNILKQGLNREEP
jgi:integration host factor subunit alpha